MFIKPETSLGLFEDAKYTWDLMLYNMGLTSHPPIVESVTATPKLKEEVEQLEDKYSNTSIIKNSITDSLKSIPSFITNNLQTIAIVLVLLFIGYLVFKKEMKIA